MGIKKKYRGQGIGTCMNYHTLLEMKKRGYVSAEYGWIDENNIASCRAGEKIDGKPYKIYRVYKKAIN
jgi:predicted GNAT family acetyltransferase